MKVKLITLKVNVPTERLLKKKAQKFAKGNMSAWLRHAGLTFTPKKDFMVRSKKSVEDFY